MAVSASFFRPSLPGALWPACNYVVDDSYTGPQGVVINPYYGTRLFGNIQDAVDYDLAVLGPGGHALISIALSGGGASDLTVNYLTGQVEITIMSMPSAVGQKGWGVVPAMGIITLAASSCILSLDGVRLDGVEYRCPVSISAKDCYMFGGILPGSDAGMFYGAGADNVPDSQLINCAIRGPVHVRNLQTHAGNAFYSRLLATGCDFEDVIVLDSVNFAYFTGCHIHGAKASVYIGYDGLNYNDLRRAGIYSRGLIYGGLLVDNCTFYNTGQHNGDRIIRAIRLTNEYEAPAAPYADKKFSGVQLTNCDISWGTWAPHPLILTAIGVENTAAAIMRNGVVQGNHFMGIGGEAIVFARGVGLFADFVFEHNSPAAGIYDV